MSAPAHSKEESPASSSGSPFAFATPPTTPAGPTPATPTLTSLSTRKVHPPLINVGLGVATPGAQPGGEAGLDGSTVGGADDSVEAKDIEDAEKASPDAPAPFPDGGFRAWSVVVGAWAISFTTWGFVNGFGVFQVNKVFHRRVAPSYYQVNQLSDRSPSDISWIGSFQLFMVLACAIISGKLFDAGYARHLLIGGTVLYVAGLFGLSEATTYTHIFLAQGVACGGASGIIFLPAVSSVSHYFHANRATALGVLATGSSVGGVVYPILLNKLLNNGRTGFGWAVRAAGFLTLGMLLIGCIAINTRLPPRKRGRWIDFSHFRDPLFSFFVAGEFLIMWGLYTPFFYLQLYAEANGIDENLAFYSLSILNAASLFGRLIPNRLADIYGPMTILIPNCLLSGILIFAWLSMSKTAAGLIVFAVLFGFSSGAYVSMMPAVTASLTTNMNELGIRIAMVFLIVSIAALTGTPIAGAIIASQDGAFSGAAYCAGAMVLAGTALLVIARQMAVRRKGTPWV